ncbi:tRNA (guanine-N1)-methyltransferase [Parvularcula bermudensis HTCC2503]|uniref:tRNA (guanine-N(1)-)-methyltransferase n=1 Tax=Parvularcula bermudensis (strain ATCC BAA-594 / HTCC2503 / KCTC 12087) TaxID=314260 RepID=E0TF93_PARBH|nr:tRNA (guanosine(37)-N1)-methyltransferase TrmD [Parvularcula bermudensis]ADM09011.1 tRNA (guanine-N1)-methyltransferase [Parvularcula bermudensis HTCC2503]
MAWHASVISLYPDAFPGVLGVGVLGRGLRDGHWTLDVANPRDFATDKHHTVDDTPAGGGPGLVMRADILARALDSLGTNDPRPRFLLSPRGAPFTQARAHHLAGGPGAVFLCGRFEGVDERLIEARDLEEISLGDFVLAGGEVAAQAMIEACVRLVPGVLGAPSSKAEESFERGLLEYPQYTRPRDFEGRSIPEILLSGNHKKVAEWRRDQSLKLTRTRRPDLLLGGVQSGDNDKG